MKRIAALTIATLALSGCGLISRADDQPEPVDVNWSESDFAQNFGALTRSEQEATCDEFWAVSQEDFIEILWSEGYAETQIVNAWNVLAEVCS